jgi:hypothetical protein
MLTARGALLLLVLLLPVLLDGAALVPGDAFGRQQEAAVPLDDEADFAPTTSLERIRERTAQATELQLENWAKNQTVIANIHITHQGGTTICQKMMHAYGRPLGDANCNANIDDLLHLKGMPMFQYRPPWMDKPEGWAKHFLSYAPVNFLSFEFRYPSYFKDFSVFPFRSPNVYSIIVIREPISRLMSDFVRLSKRPGEACAVSVDFGPKNANERLVDILDCDASATECGTRDTNNYAIRILTGVGFPEKITAKHLELAKATISRFSAVVDIECMGEGSEALRKLLDFPPEAAVQTKRRIHRSARESCGNDAVYEKLVEMHKYDIELYRYAQSISLVECAALPK